MGNPVDISAEARICLLGEKPDSSNSGLITCLSVIENIGVVGSLAGGLSSATRFAESATATILEKACTPTRESLGSAINSIQRKNLAQLGFCLFVRIKYEEYVKGLFYQGMEKKFSSWKQWKHDGYDLKGNFQDIEDIKEAIIKRALEWRMKLFVQGER